MVNYDLMFQSMVRDAKGGVNQILYWSDLANWKNQYLTPNPDTIYFMPFFSTKDVGPLVLEIPPADDGSITGTIMDSWQTALEDVGPAGADKGKGGKYLILPPDYKDKVPEGYIVLPSQTYQGYALLRSILKSRDATDIAKAVEYGKRIELYPLSAAAQPPKTDFVDAINVVVSGVIPYDVRFFQSLDRMVQAEPWIERDRAMIDPLKSLGIEKGKPFQTDAKTTAVLKAAAEEARALFDLRYETTYEPHNQGTRWFLPADKDLTDSIQSGFTKSDIYPTGGRGMIFYFAYSTIKHLGAGQFYLFVSRDKDGNPLDGGATYRLHVPPKPPVKQYWSAVLYDFATHALIRDMPHASKSSQITRPANQRRRLGGSLFRTEGSRRKGVELDSDQREGSIRSAIPILRSRRTAVREDMDPAGHRVSRGRITGEPTMKRMSVVPLAAALTLSVFSLPQICGAQTASEPAEMSVEQAREEIAYAVGLQAYLWGYPLHYYSRSTPKAIEVGGTYINDFRKFTELKTAKDKFVVTPNNVTIDAYGTFDLTAEPVVVVVPALPESRWYIVQIGDSFDEIIRNIGGTKGPQPGVYIITGPDFTGTVPGEMIQIKSRTKIGVAAVRILTNGVADLPKAVDAQRGFQLMPLSAYLRYGLAYQRPTERSQMELFESTAPKISAFSMNSAMP